MPGTTASNYLMPKSNDSRLMGIALQALTAEGGIKPCLVPCLAGKRGGGTVDASVSKRQCKAAEPAAPQGGSMQEVTADLEKALALIKQQNEGVSKMLDNIQKLIDDGKISQSATRHL